MLVALPSLYTSQPLVSELDCGSTKITKGPLHRGPFEVELEVTYVDQVLAQHYNLALASAQSQAGIVTRFTSRSETSQRMKSH